MYRKIISNGTNMLDDILIKDDKGNMSSLGSQQGGSSGTTPASITPPKKQPTIGNPAPATTSPITSEEQKEIDHLNNREHEQKKNQADSYVDSIALSIVQSFNGISKDEQPKVHKVLVSYLKDVRKKNDVIDVLTRDVKSGGIGLKSDDATYIVEQSDKMKERVLQKNQQLYNHNKKDGSQESVEQSSENNSPKQEKDSKSGGLETLRKSYAVHDATNAAYIPKQKKVDSQKHSKNEAKQPASTAPLQSVQKDNNKDLPEQKTTNITDKARGNKPGAGREAPRVTKIPKAKPLVIRNAGDAPTPTMKDIVPPAQAVAGGGVPTPGPVDARRSRLVSPIDELRLMTMADFERLGSSPENRIDKVREKIDLLEDQSYGDRVKGVQAWHNSEVNQLYITLGTEALLRQVPLNEMIKLRQSHGQPVLDMETFIQVNKLNQQLRF